MNRPIVIIIIFIALTALVAWQYFMPIFDKVSELRGDLKTWQGKLNETQALSRKLEFLKNKYNTMSDEIERVNQAVPKGEDIPGLLVQLEQLASQNGLILNSVSFAMADSKKAKKTTVVAENSLSAATGSFFSSRRRHTRLVSDWSSDVC